jgi:hypothetical protein
MQEPQRTLLSTSTNREELIAAGICLACRGDYALAPDTLCRMCRHRFTQIDYSAFAGMVDEMKRKMHPGQP